MASTLTDWQWALVALGAAAVLILIVNWATSPRAFSLRDKVIVITGGSSGIGKAIAKIALHRGAHVALLARKLPLLESARDELLASRPSQSQRVTIHAADAGDDAATSAAIQAAAVQHGGRIDAVVCSAGVSNPKEFEDTSAAEFNMILTTNVTGCRNAVAAALPYMRNPAGGRIVFISSQAGQTGIYGYTAYSASKFALHGLAQALAMELYARKILVSIAFPPDTDTPMLAAENLQKPRITKLLSESTAMVQPEAVAAAVVRGMEHWNPLISIGFDGWMLSVVTAGMAPAGNLITALVQILTAGLWRLVGLIFIQTFYYTASKNDERGRGWFNAAPGPSDGTAAGGSGSPNSKSRKLPAGNGGGSRAAALREPLKASEQEGKRK